MRHGPYALAQYQSLTLDEKVELSCRRIRECCRRWDDRAYVAVSGGLDSTVLADLCRRVCPKAPRVFFDTGLEFPENRALCRQLGAEFIRPDKSFRQILEEYGYPLASKRTAQYIHEARTYRPDCATRRLRLTGYRGNGTYSKLSRIPPRWMFLLEAPFKVSDRCCHWLKKRPARMYEKRTGRRPLLGIRADEGLQRGLTWRMFGCNAFDLKRPRSWPLAFWTEQDVRDYIAAEGLAYSELYDMGYRRSGCMFCGFGVHLEGEPNRFQLMQKTHPRQWRFCIDKLGFREVLEFIRVPWRAPPLLFETEAPRLLEANAETETP